MMVSELAKELQIEPSVVSKMRRVYREELGLSDLPELNGEPLKTIRLAHALVLESKGLTYRKAIRQVVGLDTKGLTPDQVTTLERRIDQIEHQIADLFALLQATHQGVESLVATMHRRAAQTPRS